VAYSSKARRMVSIYFVLADRSFGFVFVNETNSKRKKGDGEG
jgi:hypothetical protein